MTYTEMISGMRPAIETELMDICRELIPVSAEGLREQVMYHMGWQGEGAGPEAQGKRIRPILLLLCTGAAGGAWERALPAAAGVELLHNFSLIHDDIEDSSDLRHGRATVWKKWGIAQAINTGDAMFAMAQQAVMRLERHTTVATAYSAVKILLQASASLTYGQFLDISYERRRSMPVADYWPMVQGKTAALLAACAEMGALIGGADVEIRARFREFGLSLGLAFQSLDDVLGIWGNEALTGKSAQSDLVSGKKTLPVTFALEMNGEFARRWMKGPIEANEAAEVAALLEQEGARAFAESQADRYTQKALDALKAATQAGDAQDALRELANILLRRKY